MALTKHYPILASVLSDTRTGASKYVCYTAQSDYDWDAHVHTPTEAFGFDALPEIWEMSGLAAHVQFKNSDSGSGSQVKVGSLPAWLAGSLVGIPTFLFFVHRGEPRYASPKILQKYLAEASRSDDDSEVYIGKEKTVPADFQVFGHLLRLWTRYPPVCQG